jgi:amino acid transporter
MVIWKSAVPVLTIAVVMILRFEISNFTAGGGFAPYGTHGIFAALPAGMVFARMGFEQATQVAGEARNPRRDVSRAIIVSMMLGVGLYILLQVALIGALNPANLVSGWASPIGVGDYGPYYTIALGLGATWLAWILLSDAIVSPMGTGLVYLGASARLSYALGEEETLPDSLTRTNKRGVPVYSILLAFMIGGARVPALPELGGAREHRHRRAFPGSKRPSRPWKPTARCRRSCHGGACSGSPSSHDSATLLTHRRSRCHARRHGIATERFSLLDQMDAANAWPEFR